MQMYACRLLRSHAHSQVLFACGAQMIVGVVVLQARSRHRAQQQQLWLNGLSQLTGDMEILFSAAAATEVAASAQVLVVALAET